MGKNKIWTTRNKEARLSDFAKQIDQNKQIFQSAPINISANSVFKSKREIDINP